MSIIDKSNPAINLYGTEKYHNVKLQNHCWLQSIIACFACSSKYGMGIERDKNDIKRVISS